MTADILKGGDTASKMPFFSYSARVQDNLFVAAMFIQLTLLIAVASYGKPALSKKFKDYSLIPKATAIVLSLLLCAGLLVSSIRFYNVFEANIRNLEGFLLKYGTRGMRRGANFMSSRSVDLRRPMRGQNKESQRQIILRAESESPPGYLRGRAYDAYNSGTWLPASVDSVRMNSQSYEGILVYRTFFLGTKALQYPMRSDFMYSSDFKTDVLLVPGNYKQLELVAERLIWNENGVLVPEEWERDGGYTVFSKDKNDEAAYNHISKISPDKNPAHLSIPGEVIPVLDRVLWEIFPKDGIGKELSATNRIKAIREYFIRNYRYSLDFSMDENDSDPLETFFEVKSGHCELFAASAVLLARRIGIPARYVTGFLCFEKNPLGNYYISRLENAHAWAEVYIPEDNRWQLLEATPDDGIPTQSSGGLGIFQTYYDYFSKVLRSVLVDVRRGFFAKAVLAVIIFAYELLKDVVWNPLRGTLLLLAAILSFVLRKMIMRRRRRSRWKISENALKLAEEFEVFERKFAKKSGMLRENSETIQEWTRRSIAKMPELSSVLSGFAEQYQEARFKLHEPRDKDILEIRSLRKNFPWKKVHAQKNY